MLINSYFPIINTNFSSSIATLWDPTLSDPTLRVLTLWDPTPWDPTLRVLTQRDPTLWDPTLRARLTVGRFWAFGSVSLLPTSSDLVGHWQLVLSALADAKSSVEDSEENHLIKPFGFTKLANWWTRRQLALGSQSEQDILSRLVQYVHCLCASWRMFTVYVPVSGSLCVDACQLEVATK